MKASSFLIIPLLLWSAVHGSLAATEADSDNGTTGGAFDTDIGQADDVLLGLSPSTAVFTQTTSTYTAGSSFSTGDNTTPLSGLTDGQTNSAINNSVSPSSGSTLFGDGQLGEELGANPQVTYTLDTSIAPLGFTLSQITSINGYGMPSNNYSQGLADQDFTVAYSTVAAPKVFIPLASVEYEPYNTDVGAASTEVNLTNLTGAVGVGALQFTFMDPASLATGNDTERNASFIREIEAIGTPTEAIPEPSTYAMLFGGLGLLVLVSCLRRRLA